MKEKTKYQEKCRLRKGDQVIVTVGKCKGQTGKIERVNRKTLTVYISGVNLAHKHTKPSMTNPQGGIEDKVMPLSIGKVALYDTASKKATRVGYKTEGKKKVRISKRSGAALTT